MKRSRKEILRMKIIIFCISVVVVIAGIYVVSRMIRPDKDQYKKNREQIEELEKVDTAATERAWNKLEKKNSARITADTPRNEYGIAEQDDTSIQQALQNTVFVGDSFAEAVSGYGFVQESKVLFKRGGSVKNMDEQVQTAISLNPAALVFQFGCNDLDNYGTDLDGFIEQYRTELKNAADELPDTEIYVNCILPMTEKNMQKSEGRQMLDEYNAAIKAMCEEEEWTYIDSAFLLEENSDFYEPDGVHVVKGYYRQWLSYVIEKAGL